MRPDRDALSPQLAASYRAIMWVPQPTGMDASVEHFSEARALRTAAYLSEDIGFRLVGDLDEACILPQAQLVRVHACVRIQRASARHGCILQVSTPEVETAAQYLLKQAHELKQQADATRPDLVVEVRQYTCHGHACTQANPAWSSRDCMRNQAFCRTMHGLCHASILCETCQRCPVSDV